MLRCRLFWAVLLYSTVNCTSNCHHVFSDCLCFHQPYFNNYHIDCSSVNLTDSHLAERLYRLNGSSFYRNLFRDTREFNLGRNPLHCLPNIELMQQALPQIQKVLIRDNFLLCCHSTLSLYMQMNLINHLPCQLFNGIIPWSHQPFQPLLN